MRAQRWLVRGLRALAAVVLTASAVGRPLAAHARMRHHRMPMAMHQDHGAAMAMAPVTATPSVQRQLPCCPACDTCYTCCVAPVAAVAVTPVRVAPAENDPAAPRAAAGARPRQAHLHRQPLSTGPPTPLSV
jgi:hypothetical protein